MWSIGAPSDAVSDNGFSQLFDSEHNNEKQTVVGMHDIQRSRLTKPLLDRNNHNGLEFEKHLSRDISYNVFISVKQRNKTVVGMPFQQWCE